MSEFDEYIVHREPGQKEKADAWQTAIGLQDVEGLKVSPNLLNKHCTSTNRKKLYYRRSSKVS